MSYGYLAVNYQAVRNFKIGHMRINKERVMDALMIVILAAAIILLAIII
jgi:hypothetical protein